ncbi:hypothetical protein TDB9533_02314 [Thalassocella blandensis]|nr:hypothetical protein TDB9533_02314 [Thalassocella blandensis]
MTEFEKSLSDKAPSFDRREGSLDTPSSQDVDDNFKRYDEFDVAKVVWILWQRKLLILSIAVSFFFFGVGYSLMLPNLYRSEGIYAPTQKQGGLSGAMEYSGLAAIAGINLGAAENNDIDQAVELLNSWPFLDDIVNKHGLAPYISAVKGWNRGANELEWDDSLYDARSNSWSDEMRANGELPTSYEVYKDFKSKIGVSVDGKSGMVKISVTYYSPEISAKWVKLLVTSLNSHFQNRDTLEAKRNIKYLEDKISETSISNMRDIFYEMVEVQTKNLMLAEVGDEYLLKEVVPPMISERKSEPSRSIICILFGFMGGFLSCLYLLLREFVSSVKPLSD